MVISEGNIAECIGSGMVIFIDGKTIDFTNVNVVVVDTSIVVEYLKISILAEGYSYLLKERQFIDS